MKKNAPDDFRSPHEELLHLRGLFLGWFTALLAIVTIPLVISLFFLRDQNFILIPGWIGLLICSINTVIRYWQLAEGLWGLPGAIGAVISIPIPVVNVVVLILVIIGPEMVSKSDSKSYVQPIMMLIGIFSCFLICGIVLVVFILDAARQVGSEMAAELNQTMEKMAADPAGPFQTSTELIDGKMTLTHANDAFKEKTVQFDGDKIEIEKLRTEGFPTGLIDRYVEGDTNADGFVDETELDTLLDYSVETDGPPEEELPEWVTEDW